MIRFFLSRALGAVMMLCPLAICLSSPAKQQSHAPRDWLAFVSLDGGFPPAHLFWLTRCPVATVYNDGRMVWMDWSRERSWDWKREDPKLWQEGKLNPGQLRTLKGWAERSTFLRANPDSENPGPKMPADLFSTHVGISIGGRTRVIRGYGLEWRKHDPSANTYVKSAAAVSKRIQSLRPLDAIAYTSGPIRVTMQRPPSDAALGDALSWPLHYPPRLHPEGYFSVAYYSGDDARAIIRTLARSMLIRFPDGVRLAMWEPAITPPTAGEVNLEPTVQD